MTLDEIEAQMRQLAKKARGAWMMSARDAGKISEDLLELSDQLNLTAHPVQIRRPKGRRDSRTTTG